MKKKKLEKIQNLIFNKDLISSFYFFFLISLVLIFLAIKFHPLVGDDYYFKELVKINLSLQEYFIERYYNWTGRFSQIILSYWIFSNDTNLMIFKCLLIPLIIFTLNFLFKKIINLNIKLISMEYIILFICMFFIFPSVNEIIFWTSGAIAYLVPLFFSVLFLGLFFENNDKKNIFSYIFYLILSFLAGSAHLQAFAGCLVVSTYYMFVFYKKNSKKFYYLTPFYISFLVGGLVLFLSPGNFVRLAATENVNLISTLYKSLLFIFSSIFYLGDIQSSIIFFLIIVLLYFLYSINFSLESSVKKSNLIWIIAFLISLIAVIPAINTINTRLLFFPIFFLTIYFLKLIFNKYDFNKYLKLKNIVFYFLTLAFFIQCFLGSLSNYVYKKESDERMKTIILAKQKSIDHVYISHYSFIPSRFTYIQTPKHDKAFIDEMSKIFNIDIRFNDTLPRSKNIRKDIKYFFE